MSLTSEPYLPIHVGDFKSPSLTITKKTLGIFAILGIFSILGVFGILVLFTTPESFASETSIIPINDEITLEKTTLTMNIPKDNQLPWGFVEGKIANPVKDYPVIIQFFKNDEMVHIAQVDVDDSSDYEYKFRVRNVDDGQVINIFEGDYIVEIFKVVNQPINSNYV